MKSPLFHSLPPGLRTAFVGLALALLTILYGQAMGIVFGVNEDAIRARLKASATEVRDTVYKGDDAAIRAMIDRCWTYMKRAHLHAGGMGTTAFALMVVVGLLGVPRVPNLLLGIGLGAGGLGYSVFWMWAGFRAAGLGTTAAAKESLRWLAMPASGAFVLSTVAVLGLVVAALLSRPAAAPSGA